VYERFYDIIKSAHVQLGHARDPRKVYNHIKEDWYGVTEKACQIFISLCPECLPVTRITTKAKMNPLNMIMSDTIGRRAQIDLIDMRSQEYDGYNWILRYRDHLSGYSHVALLFSKESIEVGFEVLKIMSSTVIPDILQSDNGGEFLG
jgi:hypothetical protein